MKALLKSLVIGAFALVVSPANADPIGGSQPCASCFGSEITLEYTANSATNYTITLTIDTSSYTGLATDYIYAVSIKPGTDLALLLAVDRPIVVPRHDGSQDPVLAARLPDAERAPLPGPSGWNAAVLALLRGEDLPRVGPQLADRGESQTTS